MDCLVARCAGAAGRTEMGESRSLYSQIVMEHLRNPRNAGQLPDPDGTGSVRHPEHTDTMELDIKVTGDVITDARFRTYGCGAAIATGSMVTEMVKGRTVQEAMAISNEAVVDALGGLPPEKLHCSVLAEQVLRAAIDDYAKRSAGGQPGEVRPGRPR